MFQIVRTPYFRGASSEHHRRLLKYFYKKQSIVLLFSARNIVMLASLGTASPARKRYAQTANA
ncbi:MAG: hypothetical protein AAFR55_04550, partial [Pseudomonadota bacterium]